MNFHINAWRRCVVMMPVPALPVIMMLVVIPVLYTASKAYEGNKGRDNRFKKRRLHNYAL